MRIYTVHARPARPAADPDVVFAKEGFCWPAFVAAPVWALWQRQWLALLAWFGASIVLLLLTAVAGLNDNAETVVWLGFAVLCGAVANDWRRWRLEAAGYRLAAVLADRSLAVAERRYFTERPTRPPKARPA